MCAVNLICADTQECFSVSRQNDERRGCEGRCRNALRPPATSSNEPSDQPCPKESTEISDAVDKTERDSGCRFSHKQSRQGPERRCPRPQAQSHNTRPEQIKAEWLVWKQGQRKHNGTHQEGAGGVPAPLVP